MSEGAATWAKVGGSALLFGAIGFGLGLYLLFAAIGTAVPSFLYPLLSLTFAGLGAGLGARLGAGSDTPFGWSIATTLAGAAVGGLAGLLGAGLEATVALAALIVLGVTTAAVSR